MAKAISDHSAPKSGMAMAIAAIPVASPLHTRVNFDEQLFLNKRSFAKNEEPFYLIRHKC